ncbi:hypothetical protein MRX96_043114 [Rhipicephalus microplus]
MAVPAEPTTSTVEFSYLDAAYNKRRRDVEVVFDIPDKQFGPYLRLSKEKCLRLRDEVTDGLAGKCVLGEKTETMTQPAVSLRVARVIVNAGKRKWVDFPRMEEQKAAVKEEFFLFRPLPGVIRCVDGSFVAARSAQKAAFGCCEVDFALNVMFVICVADMLILIVAPLRVGSADGSHICVGPRIGRASTFSVRSKSILFVLHVMPVFCTSKVFLAVLIKLQRMDKWH